MSGSGLAEVWVESELLGEGTVQSVLSGKSYNKGMRVHHLAGPLEDSYARFIIIHTGP